MPGSKERCEKMHWVIKALIDNAMAGDNTAILAIYDRLEGRPAQNVVGPNNGPVQVEFKTVEEIRVFLLQRGIDVERFPPPMRANSPMLAP